MDYTKFTNAKTGRLVEIVGLFGRDWAFIPDPLPPDWDFPNELWPILDQATSEVMRLDGSGKHMPNPELVMKPLQMREALHSSSLEGTFAEADEVMLFEMHPRKPTSEHDKANDWLEVLNYARALREGVELLNKGDPITCDMLCDLHRTLTTGVRGKDKQPGEFRNVPVQIDSNARFIPPPVEDMKRCLVEFDRMLALGPDDLEPKWHPLVWCYLIHYQFETIHPFRDGNGRIGRVLLSLMTYRFMKMSLPWLYMSSFFDQYKNEYKNNLFECSSEGRWDQWIELCLRGTVAQAKDSASRLDDLVALSSEYHNELDASGNRFHAIIEKLFISPVVTAPYLQEAFDITWPTAKSDIDTLIQCGILKQSGAQRRPAIYYAPRIYDICYRDDR